jgi:hypothetical protein
MELLFTWKLIIVPAAQDYKLQPKPGNGLRLVTKYFLD